MLKIEAGAEVIFWNTKATSKYAGQTGVIKAVTGDGNTASVEFADGERVVVSTEYLFDPYEIVDSRNES